MDEAGELASRSGVSDRGGGSRMTSRDAPRERGDRKGFLMRSPSAMDGSAAGLTELFSVSIAVSIAAVLSAPVCPVSESPAVSALRSNSSNLSLVGWRWRVGGRIGASTACGDVTTLSSNRAQKKLAVGSGRVVCSEKRKGSHMSISRASKPSQKDEDRSFNTSSSMSLQRELNPGSSGTSSIPPAMGNP